MISVMIYLKSIIQSQTFDLSLISRCLDSYPTLQDYQKTPSITIAKTCVCLYKIEYLTLQHLHVDQLDRDVLCIQKNTLRYMVFLLRIPPGETELDTWNEFHSIIITL